MESEVLRVPRGARLESVTDLDLTRPRLRIAQVAPPFLPVPPRQYGGTERVVSTLTEELVRRGHDVTLFASGDSQTAAHLVPVVPTALWHEDSAYGAAAPFITVVLGKLSRALGRFDVVHNHLDHFGFPLARLAPCPVVTTVHGRLDLPELQVLYREFRDAPLVSISNAQRQPIPWANWVATVYHGIEVGEFPFSPRRGNYLAYVGRISPEKGLDVAIRVARRAGVPLKVGARLPLTNDCSSNVQADWAYYQEVIRPLLREPGVEMLGEIGGVDKTTLLQGAAALLFPIRWPEPFGLVMIEALACGTPVLALRAGSVPEVLKHGTTGFICDAEDELIEAVGRIAEIDRARCRAEVERRFSPAAMADQYESIYANLLLRRRATERPLHATTRDGISPTELSVHPRN